MAKIYDVLIIGSGASGGMAAYTLTKRGANCLMLDAGPQVDFHVGRSSQGKVERVDGSSFVTGGSQNPTMTILALSMRASEYLADQMKQGSL